MRNPNKEVLTYNGERTAEYYSQFFNPNICHVCKSVDRGNLISCDWCGLISYCSKKHKKAHHMEHAEICTITAEVLKVKPQEDTRRYSNWQQWIQSREQCMELIQQKFTRPINTYVNQMIMWSKSCIVCHQQAELRVCQECFSANYCNEHAEVFNRKHKTKCDQLMLLLNIDIETISGNTTDLSYKFLPFVNADSRFVEMLQFFMEYVVEQRTDPKWFAVDYVLSDYLSEPLTVYSGLKRIHSLSSIADNEVVIHIISTNSKDKNSAAAWESLLHLLPEIVQLIIVWSGPELTWSSTRQKLCYQCNRKGKVLFCFTVPLVYYDFITLLRNKIRSLCKQLNKNPNVIVGFYTEINEGDIWSESIKVIKTCYCPLLLAYSSEQKAQKDIIGIQKILGSNIEPNFNKRNHFSGLRPHRDLETGDIYFRNEHLLIYDTLHCYDSDSTNSCEELHPRIQ